MQGHKNKKPKAVVRQLWALTAGVAGLIHMLSARGALSINRSEQTGLRPTNLDSNSQYHDCLDIVNAHVFVPAIRVQNGSCAYAAG